MDKVQARAIAKAMLKTTSGERKPLRGWRGWSRAEFGCVLLFAALGFVLGTTVALLDAVPRSELLLVSQWAGMGGMLIGALVVFGYRFAKRPRRARWLSDT